MNIRDGVIEAIGQTPLIRLKRASELTDCTILGKAEFLNPGQSVKDRAALFIIRDALERGALKPGGVIVEGTAGNTGIGLAMVANPNNYVKVSGRIAERLARTDPKGAIWANQFDNVANRRAHVETTGPEIWEQTGGKVDGFICAVGTGGTLAGVAMALRKRRPDVVIGIADPPGAALYSYYAKGVLESSGNSITEGIGQGRITANLEGLKIDAPFQIPDEEAIPIVFDLLEQEGLCLGPSSGVNVAGAIRLARQLGPGHTIVTMLCDYGTRYQSRLFNPEFLRSKGLPVPAWLERKESVGPDFI